MKRLAGLFAVLALVPALRAQDMPLSQILIPGEDWRRIDGTFGPVSGLSVRALTDVNTVLVWDTKHKVQAVLDGTGKRISPELPDMTNRPDLVVAGELAFELRPDKKSLRVARKSDLKETLKEAVPLGVAEAGALAVLPDQVTLLAADAGGRHVWWYRIAPAGELSAGERYSTLRLKKGESRSEACSIRIDAAGRVYVAMKDGVQVFDPTGRSCGLLLNPSKEKLTGMCFGGANADQLFIACGQEIYRRRLDTTWAFVATSKTKQ